MRGVSVLVEPERLASVLREASLVLVLELVSELLDPGGVALGVVVLGVAELGVEWVVD